MSDGKAERPTAKDIPSAFSDIEWLIGLDKVLILSREYGGQEITFPHREGSKRWKEFESLIGYEDTKKLSEHVGGSQVVYIPMMSRFKNQEMRRKILERFEEVLREIGVARKAIKVVAKEFGRTERNVRRVVNG